MRIPVPIFFSAVQREAVITGPIHTVFGNWGREYEVPEFLRELDDATILEHETYEEPNGESHWIKLVRNREKIQASFSTRPYTPTELMLMPIK